MKGKVKQVEVETGWSKVGELVEYGLELPAHRVTICRKILRAIGVSFSGVGRPVIL